MSGIEVAGLVLGVVPLVMEVYGGYSRILSKSRKVFNNGHTDLKQFQIELVRQRARLETNLQKLGALDPHILEPGPNLENMLQVLMSDMSMLLKKAENLTTPIVRGSMRRGTIRESRKDKDELDDTLQKISSINDTLEFALHMAFVEHQSESSPATVSVSEKIVQSLSALTGESIENIEERFRAQKPPADNAGSSSVRPASNNNTAGTQILIICCSSLLRQCGISNPVFVEISNRFQLWHNAIETEGIFVTLSENPSSRKDLQGQPLERLIFKSLLRIVEVLTWWESLADPASRDSDWHVTLEMCSQAVLKAHENATWLPYFNPGDIGGNGDIGDKANHARAQQAVVNTTELLIDNLVNCLPSIISFKRQYTVTDSEISASDVTQLLDISETLIEPAHEALEKARKDGSWPSDQPEKDTVDFESIQRVFEEQTRALRMWKSKHREDVEIKLADRNPAKLASVADTIGNLAAILAELPASLEKGLDVNGGDRSLKATMKALETYTQSLVTLGEQLEVTEPPPAYADTSKDRVIIDLNGRIIT